MDSKDTKMAMRQKKSAELSHEQKMTIIKKANEKVAKKGY